jgi:hypothetical protein
MLQEQEECIKETQILSSLDSEYIIKYYDSFLDKVEQQQQWQNHGQPPKHTWMQARHAVASQTALTKTIT